MEMKDKLINIVENLQRVYDEAPCEEDCSKQENEIYADMKNLITSIENYLYGKRGGKKIKKYFEILNEIENNNIDITKLYILSCIIRDNSTVQKLDYIYDTWLDIDEDICLAKLCCIVDMHWEDIQEGEYGYDDIVIDLFV